jgi:hypothetical protein
VRIDASHDDASELRQPARTAANSSPRGRTAARLIAGPPPDGLAMTMNPATPAVLATLLAARQRATVTS